MTSAQRVAKRRAALRAQGLRPRTFWLPDTNTPEFRQQAAAESRAVWTRRAQDEDAMAFIEAMMDDVLEALDRDTQRQ